MKVLTILYFVYFLVYCVNCVYVGPNKTTIIGTAPAPPTSSKDRRKPNSTDANTNKDPTKQVFEACGLIKRCFSRHRSKKVEQDCIKGKSCDMLMTVGKGLDEMSEDNEAVFEIYAVARGWAAIGISHDEKMGDDYVIECCKEGNVVNLYNSWNMAEVKTNKRLRGDQSATSGKPPNVKPKEIRFYEDKIYCKFYVNKNFSKIDPDGKKHDFYLNNEYYYIMALSNALSDIGSEKGNVAFHTVQGSVSEDGREKIVSGERLSPYPYQLQRMRFHGASMILCWILFVSISVFTARYFRTTYTKVVFLKLETWLFVHIIMALGGLITLIASVYFELEASHGWRNLFRYNFHTYSGILCFCMFVTSLVSGPFLKKRSGDERPNMLIYFHIIVGHAAYILALINMQHTSNVTYAFLPCDFSDLIWICCGVCIVFHIILTALKCRDHFLRAHAARHRNLLNRRSKSISVHPERMSTIDANTFSSFSADNDARQSDAFAGTSRPSDTDAGHHGSRPSDTRSSRSSFNRNSAVSVSEQDNLDLTIVRHTMIASETPGPSKHIRTYTLLAFIVVTVGCTYWACYKLIGVEPTAETSCYGFGSKATSEEPS